jgi:hypothetical protein
MGGERVLRRLCKRIIGLFTQSVVNSLFMFMNVWLLILICLIFRFLFIFFDIHYPSDRH